MFQFLRLSTKFLVVLRLSVNAIKTLLGRVPETPNIANKIATFN